MSGTSKASTGDAESGQRWAALDKRNERLVDPSHPLLAELKNERPGREAELPAAS